MMVDEKKIQRLAKLRAARKIQEVKLENLGRPSHTFHLIMTLITLGLWLIIWSLVILDHMLKRSQITGKINKLSKDIARLEAELEIERQRSEQLRHEQVVVTERYK